LRSWPRSLHASVRAGVRPAGAGESWGLSNRRAISGSRAARSRASTCMSLKGTRLTTPSVSGGSGTTNRGASRARSSFTASDWQYPCCPRQHGWRPVGDTSRIAGRERPEIAWCSTSNRARMPGPRSGCQRCRRYRPPRREIGRAGAATRGRVLRAVPVALGPRSAPRRWAQPSHLLRTLRPVPFLDIGAILNA
jgi:hypothetical protein